MFAYAMLPADSPVTNAKADDRRNAFDKSPGTNQWFVDIKDAMHFTFSDNPRWGGRKLERDPHHQPWICEMTTQFWDAFLKDDSKAKTWLNGKGLKTLVGDGATVEKK